MNVGELRAVLAGIPDQYDVVVRAEAEDGTSVCNTPWKVHVTTGCSGEEEFLAIEVDEDEIDPEGTT